MKNKICAFLALVLCLGAFSINTNIIFGEENDGSNNEENDTIVIEKSIPEGCVLDFETLEVICDISPLENKGDPGLKG